jgi:nucleoid-associated protein YgaU
VDNKLVGSANTGADGRWTLKPTERVEPGEHDIRVDKVTEAGKVLARIELPFVRAKPFSGLPDQTLVIIQPGNNLWRIASRVYGNGLRYTDIFQANADQIRNPDLIYPGQVFGLPKTN